MCCEKEIDRIDDTDEADKKNIEKTFEISPAAGHDFVARAGEYIADPEDEQDEYKERHRSGVENFVSWAMPKAMPASQRFFAVGVSTNRTKK